MLAQEEKAKDLESKIRKLKDVPGFQGYVVITPDSIPITMCKINQSDAVCYAAVVSDLVYKAGLMLGKNEEQLKSIRMRTKKGIEIIITVNNSYILVVLQDCTEVAEVKPKEVKTEAGDFNN